MTRSNAIEHPDIIRASLQAISPDYAPTPLLQLPYLAKDLGVAAIYAKDEGRRTLGSFKSLGGTYAGLRALARAADASFADLIRDPGGSRGLPNLITASAGNHGLAVAAAAKFSGSRARIFLYPDVSKPRRRRIIEMGADIVDVEGTYDDAVAAARSAAQRGEGILVADTSDDPDDPVVADVMAGYGVVPSEIVGQLVGDAAPTHLFVQAGVGGLAAAMIARLRNWLLPPLRIVVVEPERAASVELALKNGRVKRITGSLDTTATMLACGEASDPALRVLTGSTEVITVSEAALIDAPRKLRAFNGPATTTSGAAGFAGLVTALSQPAMAKRLGLGPSSRVLLVITEGPLYEEARGE